MNTYITIRSNSGKWKVIPTKFDRNPGDAVLYENEKYLVISVGDKNDCISVMNFSVNKNNQHIKNGFKIVLPEGRFVERNIIK